MKSLRLLAIALCLTVATAAGAVDTHANEQWSPSLQVPVTPDEPLTWRDYKADCSRVSDVNGNPKPGWERKELSKAQCRREIKEMRVYLKTWTGNISSPMVGCANYCSTLYKIPF